MTKPATLPDGTCRECCGRSGPCAYHQAEGQRQWETKWRTVAAAARGARAAELARVAARFEFESDQFQTAEEKAAAYLKTGRIAPRF